MTTFTTPLPTTSTALVEGVIARLQQQLPGYDVQPYPDSPETYRLLNQRGACLVCYRGADYGDVESVDVVVNARLMLIDVHVVAHNLNGPTGAVGLLELARLALVGRQIPGFDRMRPVRERFLRRHETMWIYALTLAAGTLAVEQDDNEPIGVLLQHLTAESPFATSEIPSESPPS